MASRRQRRRKRRLYRKIILVLSCILIAIVSVTAILILKQAGSRKKQETPVASGENVTAKDTTEAPAAEEPKSSAVITLTEANITMNLGDAFQEPGYSATDEKTGANLTDQVVVDTSALNHSGEQKVVYSVADGSGTVASVERTVEVLPNQNYGAAGLPICMYHYVYDPADPPEVLNSNYISTDRLEEEIKYLSENGYYYPTWQEVRDYIDGKQLLPEKSIVITFDDGPTCMELGIPILEKYQVPATSFVIANWWNSREAIIPYESEYLTLESHSYDMHKGGGSGAHGGIYPSLSKEEVLADLEKSFEICVNRDAFAYPFGDYSVEGCSTLAEAGIICAVTTEYGKCYPGDNPLLLPRIRVHGEQSLDSFVSSL